MDMGCGHGRTQYLLELRLQLLGLNGLVTLGEEQCRAVLHAGLREPLELQSRVRPPLVPAVRVARARER